MRELTLTEYVTTAGVQLSPEERDALIEIVPSVTIRPSFRQEGHYDLTPGSMVGAVELETLAIEIRPKLPIDRVLFLVSYAMDPRRWLQLDYGFGEADSLVDAIIPGFAAQARRALARGVLHGYRSEEDALSTVRGQIRFGSQIQKRFGRCPPVEVVYDDFTDDILENRFLKAAIDRLRLRRVRSSSARALLGAYDALLSNVASVQFDPRMLPEVLYTRLNEHYRPAIVLAGLILRSTAIELQHGKYRASAFLVDMNQVFEDFVVVALREALGLTEREFPQNLRGRSLYLDEECLVSLEPDFSWWDGNRCTLVGDVKYKRINVAGIKHPDIYQLLAYTIASRVPRGLLVYAAGEAQPRTVRIAEVGKQLEIIALELSGTPDDILAQIATIADLIRRLRTGK